MEEKQVGMVRSSCIVGFERLLLSGNLEGLPTCRCDREGEVIATVFKESLTT